jgi:MoaA/NifB/PqqE/SkfB family radical SAM enzyme
VAGLRHLRSRSDYIRRHVRLTLPYLTVRRVSNLVRNEVEFRTAQPRPRSVPPYIKIEATPLCHMTCGGCAHHSKEHKKSLHNQMHLTIDTLARIVEPVEQDLLGVSLSYIGEPLLNKELPQLVRWLHERRICTSFPTNLSVPLPEERAEALVRAGLDLMLVSLDGASEETYSKYRTGGKFSLVVENVRKLADIKRRLNSRRPFLVWKMVVFPHNEHEVEVAKRTWRSRGFDGFETVLDYDSAESQALSRRVNSRLVEKRKPCFWAWNSSVLRWDGEVQPCCVPNSGIHLGNAREDGLLTVWRSDAYVSLREGFDRSTYGETMHPGCRRCLGVPDPPSDGASPETGAASPAQARRQLDSAMTRNAFPGVVP